jgi:hypothetical protein
VDAQAFTVGTHIVFAAGRYEPDGVAGRQLLAHELAHSVQQTEQHPCPTVQVEDRHEAAADQAAAAAANGRRVTDVGPGVGRRVQRQQPYRSPGVDVRLPAFEETARQVAEFEPGGRPLTKSERALAEGVFGRSVDYSRVRILETSVLPGTTAGNVIRTEPGFDIRSAWHAEVLIHELTHVWQYQRGGTGYISVALRTQLAAWLRTGSRNTAYDYLPAATRSFFDFTPEQQGLIVQNFFAMRRDQNAGVQQTRFLGNHMDRDGRRLILDRAQRMAEISTELPVHEVYVGQLRASMPKPEWDILTQSSEVMQTPGGELAPIPAERAMVPLRPVLRVDF